MSEYYAAVCSHNRHEVIAGRTLKTLHDGGVPRKAVHVFVTPGQETAYREHIPRHLYGEIMTGAPGLWANRNAATLTFPEGANVISLDDDVLAVQQLERNKLVTVRDLDATFSAAFSALAKTDATLWGIYPVPNAFYMTPRLSRGLKFCIGQLMGFINRQDEILTCRDKEDYERTLLRYESDGEVIRFDFLAAKSPGMRTDPGGQQSTRRLENNRDAVTYMLRRWPEYVRPKSRTRDNGYLEIRLTEPTGRADNGETRPQAS